MLKSNLEYELEIAQLKELVKRNMEEIAQLKELNYQYELSIVRKDGLDVRKIENPTHEIYLEAVKENGYAIKYIPEEKITEEILLEAEISKKDDSIPF